MRSAVLDIADGLIQFGLLAVLVTLPPALFLGLGLKKKGRVTRAFVGALILAVAACVLGITLQGYYTGEVFGLSRYGRSPVLKADDPELFLVAAVFWTISSCVLIAVAIYALIRAALPSNTTAEPDARKSGAAQRER